jgi:uncharacterized protein Yka (UPF0111/DUF47 family)
VIELVFNKFSSRTECMKEMSLIEFIDFYEGLADKAEKVAEEANRNNGK